MRPNGSPSYFRMNVSAKVQSQKWLTFLIKNYYPLPKKWLAFLINCKGVNFAKNDLPLGYHQVHMEPTNVWKIHLKTNFGTY